MSSASDKQSAAKRDGHHRHPPKPNAVQGVGFVDGSLCAARATLWGGSVSAELFLPYLERMDEAGFQAIDILDPTTTLLAVQHGESPWRLLRVAAARLKKTPPNVWISARCLLGTQPLAPEMIETGVATLANCGVRSAICFDAANDVEAIESAAQICSRHGIDAGAALVHIYMPPQDERYYADRARPLAGKVQTITLVDIVGSIDPVTARNLVAAVRDGAPDVSIGFKTYCRSGVAEQCAFEAVFAGASLLHTCTDAMAGGWSLPPVGYFAEHFMRRRIPVALDRSVLAEMDEYFVAVAQAHGLPLGRHELPDASAERFSIPVALLRELTAASDTLGVPTDKLSDECVAVRKDLAVPSLAHPLGAMVLAQARTNLAAGKRYSKIVPEVGAYLAGSNGGPAGSVSSELSTQAAKTQLRKAVVNPSQTGIAGDHQRRMLAAWFPDCDVTGITDSGIDPVHAGSPQQYLKELIERSPAFRSIRVHKGQFYFEVHKSAGQSAAGLAGDAT